LFKDPTSTAVVICEGRGIIRTKKNPKIIGIAVPSASTSRKSDVLPGKSACEMDEKKKAESPKPDMTTPTVTARWRSVRHTG
jgi:hypothetical protein